ncbi:MAG: CBS domain-containing protein [Glaciimonas sp.]|nr:CBS domain-containing protein [Glaciimonas sp.]
MADFEPFSTLAPERLLALFEAAQLVCFAAGAPIFDSQLQTGQRAILIIFQGRVSVRSTATENGVGELLGPGMLLPLDLALPLRESVETYTAAENCVCWSLAAPCVAALLAEPAVLRWAIDQCWRYHERLMQNIATDIESNRIAAQINFQPLSSLIKQSPLTIDVSDSVQQAVALMTQHRIGSVIVTDAGRVAGILTESDTLRRVLAPGLDLARAVSTVMTPAPVCLPMTSSVAEAALAMASRSIRHLPVVSEDGALVGVISERDLFVLQRSGFGHLEAPIERATSIAALRNAVDSIRTTCSGLFRYGMSAEQITSMVSALNDRVLVQLIHIVGEPVMQEGQGGQQVRYCWLAFGSEGRQEQTFSTDQDNGIIFVPPPGADAAAVTALRNTLLQFASTVNVGLDACGFPLCEGDIMARNPKWCLTFDEWKSRFATWICTSDRQSLVLSSIFFDLRPLYGDAALAETLRDTLFALCRDNPLFLHLMAKNALETSVPLGVLSRFSTDGGKFGGTIDLKKRAARLFVDIGRIFSLAHGVRATNTAQRLLLGGARAGRKSEAIEADVAAFHFVQTIRIRGQLNRSAGSHNDPNRINPYALNEIDQRVLIEALRQVKLLQTRLRVEYQI